MTDTLKPRDAKEVEDAVRWALDHDKALELVGQGSKRDIGRPSQTDLTLDLSGLTGVTLYEPAELVLSDVDGDTTVSAVRDGDRFEVSTHGPARIDRIEFAAVHGAPPPSVVTLNGA